MTSQFDLIEIANSLTDYEADKLIKILQSRMSKKSHLLSPSPSPFYTIISSLSSSNSFAITPPPSHLLERNLFQFRNSFLRAVSLNLHGKNDFYVLYVKDLVFILVVLDCSFVTNIYDEQALSKHLKTCKGKISKDFTLITLKVSPLNKEEGTTETKYKEINLNERHCLLCKDIHNMYVVCYGENLGCWSSNTTLVNSSTSRSNNIYNCNINSGKGIIWDKWMF
ncbi:11768_t:CDS:2 [Dentiscutata heterogama]|uniref:11768_t:CDS:1 n=1 Tax=Dentiscutata heterogama TaxID=1316150 RepID=A0ACA9KRB4_9GLOM|nr:11768_t:CDS:2 [Dentiscutata heterogama]